MPKVTLTLTMRALLRSDEPVAPRLSSVANRYQYLISSVELPFTKRELLAIVTANLTNPTDMCHPIGQTQDIAANVVDSLAFDELSHWEDADDLISIATKINELTPLEQIALVEYIEDSKVSF